MISQDQLGRLARELGERLQGASQAPEEIHKGVQQVVRGACERLELVSREDFDILMEVLQRTRSRVEALEARVAVLEEALTASSAEGSTGHDDTDEVAGEASAEPKARGDGDEDTP